MKKSVMLAACAAALLCGAAENKVGETVAGLNVIDRIATVRTDRYDRPVREILVLSVKPDQEYNNLPKNSTTDE